MPKILVIHGAGMNMRGKVQLDVFGPMTLPEYDERIRGYAKELGVEVEIFHSNVEGEIVRKRLPGADRRGEPERRGRFRDRRLRARAARHPGPARGGEVAGRAR
jgi:hypothetical protein